MRRDMVCERRPKEPKWRPRRCGTCRRRPENTSRRILFRSAISSQHLIDAAGRGSVCNSTRVFLLSNLVVCASGWVCVGCLVSRDAKHMYASRRRRRHLKAAFNLGTMTDSITLFICCYSVPTHRLVPSTPSDAADADAL